MSKFWRINPRFALTCYLEYMAQLGIVLSGSETTQLFFFLPLLKLVHPYFHHYHLPYFIPFKDWDFTLQAECKLYPGQIFIRLP